jgi:hypothetical protein
LYGTIQTTNQPNIVANNSTNLGGQAPSYYTNITDRLGYTPVNRAGDTSMTGNFSTSGTQIDIGRGEAGEKRLAFVNNNRSVYFYLGADGNAVGLWDINANRNRWFINNSGSMDVWNNLTAGGIFSIGGDIIFNGQSELGGTYYTSTLIGSPGPIGNQYGTYLRYYHHPGLEAGAQMVLGGGAAIYLFKNNGSAYASGTWVSQSDTRVKSNQVVISNSLNKVEQLKGVTYTRNDIMNMDGSSIVGVGLIAQDVAKVLPECVEISSEGPKNDPDGPGLMSLNYNGIIALLVNAVKELNAKVNNLETQLNTLKN